MRYDFYYLFTLSELIGAPCDANNIAHDYPYQSLSLTLKNVTDYYQLTLPASIYSGGAYADYISELWTLIVNRYWEEYCAKGETETDTNCYRFFLARLLNMIIFTYDKYSVLLKAIADKKTHLLDKLERGVSGSVTNTGTQTIEGSDFRKDNDTPQGSGDFSGDTHATFVTSGTTGSERTDDLLAESESTETYDNEPIIDRLKKIQDSFQNIMFQWVNEFRILFVEEAK